MSESKVVEFGQSARNKMLEGIKTLARVVGVSMGPRGRGVAIQQRTGGPAKVSRDGVSISEAVVFRDAFQHMGAKMVHEAADRCSSSTGDGTSAATIIAASLMIEGSALVAAGLDAMSIKRGMDKGLGAIVKELELASVPVASSEQIAQVATISANSDKTIGDLIAAAIDQIGKDGTITVEDGKSTETTLRVAQGFEFDRGFLSPVFITDHEKQKVVLEDAFVWLINANVSTHQQFQDMLPVLEFCHSQGKPIVVIAETIEGEPLANLVVNTYKGALKSVAIKAPGYGARRGEMLHDLAVLLGGNLRDSTSGDDPIRETAIEELGRAKRIEVFRDRTIIVGPDGREKHVEEHVKSIRSQITQETSKWDRERTEQRLAKLLGGVAIISIGGLTDVEVSERRDRVIDSLGATKSAIKQGLSPGGGAALLKARQAVIQSKFSTGNDEEEHGLRLLLKVMSSPFKQILKNAGEITEDTAGVIMAQICDTTKPNIGYDAQKHKVVDMIEAGIIDPTLVIKTALENAVSVAGQFLTTEAAICFEPEDPKQNQGQGMMM